MSEAGRTYVHEQLQAAERDARHAYDPADDIHRPTRAETERDEQTLADEERDQWQ